MTVTDNDIFDLYRRSGNPQFDPATGADDNGVDMTVMLSAAIQGGIGGYKPVAFALINIGDSEALRAAGAIFGCTLWGADLTVAQQQQTVWDYNPTAGAWGGHAIAAAGTYADNPTTTLDRTGLVTWAHELNATDTFISHQVREAYVVIWPWHLGTKAFQQGIDVAALAADYTALTGRQFPIPTPAPPAPGPIPVPPSPGPAPSPTPPPSPVPVSSADQALAAAISARWLQHPLWRPRDTAGVAAAVQAWLSATGQHPGS